ncbi:hypothetical protein COV15_01955 [Candidatus Woesearchaeota archaeon CG10_big_fil_rev_8_21_14_0_10_34_12]|nr:MAG: hypothetical protein COV15_01955 [Candidatus Woesearchaeota archaeon CG10_big_fil_rev_8_21_14_0_10_34_12]
MENKRGQVWVETVIYTLIGLVILGLLLGVTKPKIDELKDKMIIKQTIEALNTFDLQIQDIKYVAGNKRVIEFKIDKGRLVIDPANEQIYWILENSKSEYSQPGKEISNGEIMILTEKGQKTSVRLTLSYSNLDLSVNLKQEEKILQASAQPYRIIIENLDVAGITKIDVSV